VYRILLRPFRDRIDCQPKRLREVGALLHMSSRSTRKPYYFTQNPCDLMVLLTQTNCACRALFELLINLRRGERVAMVVYAASDEYSTI
jgi:hypothetical protein